MTTLRVIGAGLPRTGTTSLKLALEQLLASPCYHMTEFNDRFHDDEDLWLQALDGDLDSLARVLQGWVAAVDWPASVLWAELATMYPDALVVLSHRESAAEWWSSLSSTVWENLRQLERGSTYQPIASKMLSKTGFGSDWDRKATAIQIYDQMMSHVTQTIDSRRLLIWQPSDGWEPLCAALDVPVPATPFPHHNTEAEFRARSGYR